jgi:hypothetical protein
MVALLSGMTSQARVNAYEAQGARCGHIDGRARVGAYVIGEEYAAECAGVLLPHGETPAERVAFERGYAAGYRVGADDEELDPEIVNAPLPEEC